ncbi:hypothetical protein VPH35_036289 [Triticum aestivum]|uniref:DNA helicase Pif1-like 2B domain-containing protein n=1 Tax=Aegilops tauschii subsp. strangulata TaxID=200361 RepID=A0A453B8W4_AEGTS
MLYPAELLNSLQFHGILNHKLELKVEIHVMLLCNIKQSDGLCNCTRMVILTWKKIHQSTDNNRNTCGRNGIYIPRIVMSPTESAWPFVLKKETISNIGLLCYDYQEKQGAISKQGRTIST